MRPGTETLTAGRACTTRGGLRLPIRVFALPALLADQRHEADIGDVLALELVLVDARDPNQLLRPLVPADRDDHAATDLELMHQRFGTSGAPAETRMASKGASSAQPSVPSAWRTWTLSHRAAVRLPAALSASWPMRSIVKTSCAI